MPRGSSPPAPPAAATNHPHNPHLDVAVTFLWILTPLTATISLVIVCIAMTTNQWLHTEEKMNNPNYNGTGERDYLSKYTVSGLWTLCYTNPGEMDLHCFNIDYFPREEYSPDPNDSTMAIPSSLVQSGCEAVVCVPDRDSRCSSIVNEISRRKHMYHYFRDVNPKKYCLMYIPLPCLDAQAFCVTSGGRRRKRHRFRNTSISFQRIKRNMCSNFYYQFQSILTILYIF